MRINRSPVRRRYSYLQNPTLANISHAGDEKVIQKPLTSGLPHDQLIARPQADLHRHCKFERASRSKIVLTLNAKSATNTPSTLAERWRPRLRAKQLCLLWASTASITDQRYALLSNVIDSRVPPGTQHVTAKIVALFQQSRLRAVIVHRGPYLQSCREQCLTRIYYF